MGAAHRQARHRDGDRRAGARQRGRRALHGARRGVADGAALRPCGDVGARPRRLSGNPPGRHGGAGEQGLVHRNVRRDARARRRRGDPHRDLGPAGAGAPKLAVRSARGARREQRDRVAGCAACGRACAQRCGGRRDARRNRVGGAADHLRAAAALQRERARAAGAARSRDAGARRDPRKPARHRGCDARRILRSGAPGRPDRSARQGARFHHQVGERLVVRSRSAADLDRSGSRAGRARREGDGRAARAGQHRGRARRGRNVDPPRCRDEAARRRLAEGGARRTRQSPGRLGEHRVADARPAASRASVSRAAALRGARSGYGADLRRRRVRPMGPEHASRSAAA